MASEKFCSLSLFACLFFSFSLLLDIRLHMVLLLFFCLVVSLLQLLPTHTRTHTNTHRNKHCFSFVIFLRFFLSLPFSFLFYPHSLCSRAPRGTSMIQSPLAIKKFFLSLLLLNFSYIVVCVYVCNVYALLSASYGFFLHDLLFLFLVDQPTYVRITLCMYARITLYSFSSSFLLFLPPPPPPPSPFLFPFPFSPPPSLPSSSFLPRSPARRWPKKRRRWVTSIHIHPHRTP